MDRLRSVVWKLLLGVLPAAEDGATVGWGAAIAGHREHYERLKQRYIVSHRQVAERLASPAHSYKTISTSDVPSIHARVFIFRRRSPNARMLLV